MESLKRLGHSALNSSWLAHIMTAAFNISIRTVPKLIPLFQYWNCQMFDHFYTPDPFEIGAITAEQPGTGTKKNFVSEGISCFIFKKNKDNDMGPIPGTVPLHRYYSASRRDHLYTAHPGEVFGNEKPVEGREYGDIKYTYQGIVGHIHSSMQPNTVPLCRFYAGAKNKMDHFYCLSNNASDTLSNQYKHEYTLQGIEGYVYKAPSLD